MEGQEGEAAYTSFEVLVFIKIYKYKCIFIYMN